MRVIVTRHPAAVEFIRQHLRAISPTANDRPVPVLETATPEDVRGKIVYGNVPLHLACLAKRVYAIEFEGQAPRGQEYTIEDMQSAGAKLVCYAVSRQKLYEEESIKACINGLEARQEFRQAMSDPADVAGYPEMTPEEADAEFDASPALPLTQEEIRNIVAFVTPQQPGDMVLPENTTLQSSVPPKQDDDLQPPYRNRFCRE